MLINELIQRDNIPDKPVFHATTTHKFKQDLWDFFNKDAYKQLTFVEFGTSSGYTSMIASYLFKEVHTINLQQSENVQNYLSSRQNIFTHAFDLYSGNLAQWNNIPTGDIFFIDAGHDYPAVLQDINSVLTCVQSQQSKKIIVFDDYGIFPGVKRAVDEYIDKGILEVVTGIGQKEGYVYGEPTEEIPRTLFAVEGLICREV